MARRNNRCNITCLFKQDTDVATVLQMKSHQIYQDIILLQQSINDLINTNHHISPPPPNIIADSIDSNTRTSDQDPNIELDRSNSPSNLNYILIDRLINSSDIASQLKKLAYALAESSHLSFYMDGSLIRTIPTVDIMGLGWVNEFDESIRFLASATMWPSSTKAEILACLTALLTTPRHSKVNIYTDSQATIDGFHRLPNFKQLSIRK